MTCETCRARLVELQEQLLTPADEDAVRRHLDACAACAGEHRAMSGLRDRLIAMADDSLAQRVLRDVRRAQASAPESAKMRSRFVRNVVWVGIAAAVVAAIGLFPWFRGGRSSELAFAEVVNRAAGAGSVRFVTRFEGPGGPLHSMEVMCLDPGRARVALPSGRVHIISASERRGLILIPAEQRAVVVPASATPWNAYEELLTLRDRAVEDLGLQMLAGRETHVFRVNYDSQVTTVWADPQSGLPVRMEAPWSPPAADGQAPADGRSVTEGFEFDLQLDEALFDLTPPEGYALTPLQDEPEAAAKLASRNIVNIVMACQIYRTEHDNAWPESITSLERYGVDADLLRNPRRPQFDVGYVYLKPREPENAALMVIYERFDDQWSSGVAVGFVDGHSEFIAERARFDELLAAARSAAP